ncbi:MAG: DUF3662 domain-containing protein, partial [Coriobacteriaceae bacterium]|nr:DUF3662 domain-containing protein [Coriobacteriaceae bacterium]
MKVFFGAASGHRGRKNDDCVKHAYKPGCLCQDGSLLEVAVKTKREMMGIFSKFESHVEDTFEGAANKLFESPLSPVQIAKRAEKQMRREKLVGAGKQYAPTLYTVLVNHDDDRHLFGY